MNDETIKNAPELAIKNEIRKPIKFLEEKIKEDRKEFKLSQGLMSQEISFLKERTQALEHDCKKLKEDNFNLSRSLKIYQEKLEKKADVDWVKSESNQNNIKIFEFLNNIEDSIKLHQYKMRDIEELLMLLDKERENISEESKYNHDAITNLLKAKNANECEIQRLAKEITKICDEISEEKIKSRKDIAYYDEYINKRLDKYEKKYNEVKQDYKLLANKIDQETQTMLDAYIKECKKSLGCVSKIEKEFNEEMGKFEQRILSSIHIEKQGKEMKDFFAQIRFNTKQIERIQNKLEEYYGR